MPAVAKLVTLTQAKEHLQITLPEGDPSDAGIQDRLNEAEETILKYLAGASGAAAGWTDPTTAPGPVTSAIKLLLGRLQMGRGDDDDDWPMFWTRIEFILAQYHTPGIA